MSEKPLSENIGSYVATGYSITAAIWRPTNMYGQQRDQYEIGIRDLETGAFKLLQSDKYNFQSVQDVASAICCILEHNTTENFSYEFLEEWFT